MREVWLKVQADAESLMEEELAQREEASELAQLRECVDQSAAPAGAGKLPRRLSLQQLANSIPDFTYLKTTPATLYYARRGYKILFGGLLGATFAAVTAYAVLQYAELYFDGDLAQLWAVVKASRVPEIEKTLTLAVGLAFVLGAVLGVVALAGPKPVYLVDFSVLRPPDSWRVNSKKLMNVAVGTNVLNSTSVQFMIQVGRRAGLTHLGTYLPPAITESRPKTMKAAREEAEVVMFGCLDDLFERTKINPKSVDILIVNCSLFNPTPSLTAMIINHYKMRNNVVSYNLSGMGCSAGLISISLAKELLQVHRNATAVVVSTENITQNFYLGNSRSMLIPNMLFRVGGAAVALSNKRSDAWRAKYKLLHVIRTNRASDDDAYTTVFQQEDAEGKTVGVKLEKRLMNVAGETLKINMTTLGPLVLPIFEQVKFGINLVQRKFLKMKVAPYIPNFKKAFDHFCIHAGGRGVIDALEDNLKLSKEHCKPSREALFHYGNTSSASIWYELAWSEACGKNGVLPGEKVWQIAFGSGFKCNSAVWKALRHNKTQHTAWLDP